MLKLKKLVWTSHAQAKLRQYRLSEARVRRILNSPLRVEEGIAEDTIVMMQPASVKTTERGKPVLWTQEIWVMISETPAERRIVSAWRYPGMTKPGDPLPPEIIRELRSMGS